MSRRSLAWMIPFVAVALAGCGQQPVNVVPPSFDRPEDLVFTCVQTGTATGDEPMLVDLGKCKGLAGSSSDPFVLVALLTQTARGEVAAVDLRENEPLDSSDVVPGYTFLRVGEVPVGIALDPEEPHVTYVANFGSQSVMAIPTVWFFPLELELVDQAAPTFAFENVNLPGAPTDLVLSEDGSFLFAPIPSLGVVAQLAIDADGGFVTDMMGDPVVVQIPLSPASALPVPPPNDPSIEYGRVCPESYPQRAAATLERTPVALGMGPEPVRVVVDGSTLLVADLSEPVIHRFDLGAYGAFTDDTATTLQGYAQLATAVPVVDLALTPPVPATLGATAASAPARYLYAIDATDRTVLAMDYLPSSPSYGAVLATHVGLESSDRIRTAGTASARALAVAHPGYYTDTGAEADYCSTGSEVAEDAGPGFLRGVFLVIAMTDGTLRFVDVHDLDAPCRGSACANTDASTSDEEVYIQRHRARVGAYLQSTIELASTPSLSFDASPGRIGVDGQPTSGSGPGLDVLAFDPAAEGCTFPAAAYFDQDCRAYMKPVYGASGSPLICAQSDAWGTTAQTWSATWNGPITGTQGGRGRLAAPGLVGALSLSDPFMPFCDLGVLGTDDVAASGLGPDDPEVGYGGDQLVITSDVPAHRRDDPACADFVIPDSSSEERDLIAFRIVTAAQGALELQPIDTQGMSAASYVAAIMSCFPDPVSFEVRTRNAYSVVGSTDGFLHRVADGGTQCLVDLAQPVDVCDPLTYRNGRAMPGETFVSPHLVFQIEGDVVPLAGSEAQLLVSLGLTPPQLSLDAGTQPVTVRYSPTDGYLYSVDMDTIGLARVDLQPVNRIDTIQ